MLRVYTLLQRLFPGQPFHVDGFHQEVRSCLPQSGAILDLGCGSNEALACYRTDALQAWGVDFQVHPQLQHPEWFRPLGPDGRIPFPDGSFDVVSALWVLEHVRDGAGFLREVSRVLKSGGYFVGHTLNRAHYVVWLRRLFGLLPHSFNQKLVRRLYGREPHDTFPAWYRLNSEKQMRRAGSGAALELLRVQRYADPGYFRFWEWLQCLAVRTDWLLDRLRPGWGRIYLTATFRKQEAASLARAA
jgi:SAM-dependent methyltransferase